MGWREKWEEFKESVRHHGEPELEMTEDERKALHAQREAALHRTDKATGSETLDD